MTNGNQWTNFVKDWANENGTSYMTAIKDPTLSTAYKQRKKDTKQAAKTSHYETLKAEAVALAETLTPFPEKKARGRPRNRKEEGEENITLTLGEM